MSYAVFLAHKAHSAACARCGMVLKAHSLRKSGIPHKIYFFYCLGTVQGRGPRVRLHCPGAGGSLGWVIHWWQELVIHAGPLWAIAGDPLPDHTAGGVCRGLCGVGRTKGCEVRCGATDPQ